MSEDQQHLVGEIKFKWEDNWNDPEQVARREQFVMRELEIGILRRVEPALAEEVERKFLDHDIKKEDLQDIMQTAGEAIIAHYGEGNPPVPSFADLVNDAKELAQIRNQYLVELRINQYAGIFQDPPFQPPQS